MKIVLLGNFNAPFTSETHHARTLHAMGHEVTRLQESQVTREQILEAGLRSDLVVAIHTHGWNSPGFIPWQMISDQLKEKGIPFITYHLDLWFGLEREKDITKDDYYKSLHHFFTVDKLMADWLNENTDTKGHYLPAGVFGPECIMPMQQRVRYDIVFTGSRKYHPEYPYRPQLVDFLRENYGQRFIHIGNDGDVGQIRGMPLNQIYRNAKIAVGDTLNLNFEYPYYFSDRLFEQPGRGAFQIFPNIKGVEDLYEDGKEIVLYEHGNLADLKEKIDYYMNNEAEREAIRRAGFERTKRDHTYTSRWQTILDTLFGDENDKS